MEYFDIVDENGTPTGDIISRQEAHRLGTRHRTAHIWVVRKVDNQYQVLLQKRSLNKDSHPGQYDTSSAGHIQAGDDVLVSAQREFFEELGIKAKSNELKYIGKFNIYYQKEFNNSMFCDNEVAFVHIYQNDIDINSLKLQEEEVERVKWFYIKEAYDSCKEHNKAFCVPIKSLELLIDYLKIY